MVVTFPAWFRGDGRGIGGAWESGGVAKGRKGFFFEKKKQKTFVRLQGAQGRGIE